MSGQNTSAYDVQPDALTLPFWTAAKDGRFILPQCRACGRFHFYPRAQCPYCASDDLTWIDAKTGGSIVSCTTVSRAPAPAFEADIPYTLAVVETADGPCLFGRIIGSPNPKVGDKVEIGFEAAGNYPRVVFRTGG